MNTLVDFYWKFGGFFLYVFFDLLVFLYHFLIMIYFRINVIQVFFKSFSARKQLLYFILGVFFIYFSFSYSSLFWASSGWRSCDILCYLCCMLPFSMYLKFLLVTSFLVSFRKNFFSCLRSNWRRFLPCPWKSWCIILTQFFFYRFKWLWLCIF